MPVLRQNIQKGTFSNYGTSIFTRQTSNTKYFKNAKLKQPTMRGSFPRRVRSTLSDEGITNARTNYNRGLELNRSAAVARSNAKIDASKTIAVASFNTNTKSSFEGNAARQLTVQPKIKSKPKAEIKPSMHAVAGNAKEKSVLNTAALSPMFLMLAKVAAAIVIVVAVMAFIRVGITSATVSLGLNSQQISKNIDDELVNKNALEVQDSTLGNTGRIRQAAADYALVAPASIETISLGQDVLAYDENNNVSLVESLNRVAHKTN